MPFGSVLSIVGILGGNELVINSGNALFMKKSVITFNLGHYLKDISNEEREKIFTELSNDLRDGGKIFGTNIVKEIPLEKYLEGFEERAAVANEGKILINCQ